jgi:hypothetical protein
LASNQISCAYCATFNTASSSNCIACGAPIVLPRVQPVTVTNVPEPVIMPTPLEASQPGVPSQPLGQQVKQGLAAVGAGLGFAGIGGLVLRTLAEALAIMTSALIIGFSAGSVCPFPDGWFVFLPIAAGGGALIGLAVGSVTKRAIFVLFSATFGALLGVGVALAFKLNSPGTPWLPLFAIAGACMLALLGGRSNRTARFTRYQRLRPLLGAIGGLLFGAIGFSAGWIVH